MKKFLSFIFIVVFTLGLYVPVSADAVVGDEIVTLGQDLSAEDKNKLLEEFGVKEGEVEIIYVTNTEEHEYLGDFIPKAQIGSRAISSAKITVGEENTGIVVYTNNITYVTGDMYANALATAGLEDVRVQVSAPFPVSGTGALTGIMKAYEDISGEEIDKDQKLVATEEMVQTTKLVEEGIDSEKAAQFFEEVKTRISQIDPETEEEIKKIIIEVAAELNITITDERMDELVQLFKKIQELDIDWEKVNQVLDQAKEKWDEFAATEEGQGVINAIKNFFKEIIDIIVSIFSKEQQVHK